MKKFFYMISTVAFMASFASCNKMEQGNTPAEAPSIDGTTTITVSATVPQTKVLFMGKDQQTLRWTSGDLVTLFGENGTALTSTAPETAPSINFTFAGWPVEDTPKYLVYNGPSSNEVEEGKLQSGNAVRPPVFEDGKFIMTVKGSQQITNDYSFGKNENLSIGALAIEEDGGYTTVMKNVCGVIKFSFANKENIQVKNVLIRNVDASAAPLVGMVKVDYNNGEPTAEVIEGTGKTEVLVKAKNYTENGYFENKYYCACVLPGIYEPEIVLNYDIEGVEPITLKAKDGAKIEIKRNEIFDFGTIDNIKLPDQPGAGEGGDETGEPMVITLDFSTSWPFNEELASNVKITEKKTYTLTQNGATYSFDVFSEKGEKGGGFYFNGSSLRLTNADNKGTGQRGYLSVPAIAGYKLTALDATVTNTTGTKNLYLYSGCAVNDGIISLSGKLSDAMQIDVTVSKSGHFDITGTSANTSYYLYTESNNYQLGKLVLTYTK